MTAATATRPRTPPVEQVGAHATGKLSIKDMPSLQKEAVIKGESDNERALSMVQDAELLLMSVVAILQCRLHDINSPAAYGARTLLELARDLIGQAYKSGSSVGTEPETEKASCALHEALAVLELVYDKIDDTALFGALTLARQAKELIDSAYFFASRLEA